MKTGYNKVNFALIALLTAVIVSRIAAVPATVPVITDIGIISGERGTAVTIKADASFTAGVSASGEEISIEIAKGVYGLSDFFFDKLPAVSPVASIRVVEKERSGLSIVFTMKVTAETDVRTVYKGGQFMALLSRNPASSFAWNAEINGKKEDRIEKSVAVVPEKPGTPARLTNVRLLERDKISELAFEFDRRVSGTVKRTGNTISLSVDNAKNSLNGNEMKLPDNSSFKTVRVNDRNGNVSVVFRIDTSGIDTSLNIAFTQGEVLSIFIAKKSDRKATLWTSGRGLAVDHTFYNVPSYSSDMKSIGERAKMDMMRKISKDTVFAVKVEHPAGQSESAVHTGEMRPVEKPAEKLPEWPAETPGVQSAEKSNGKPVEKAVEAARSERISMKVVSSGLVNMRKYPSLKGRVCRKLNNNEIVECVKQGDNWTKVVIGNDTGFVASAFIRRFDANVPDNPAEVTETALLQTVVPQERLLTKVSTTIAKSGTTAGSVILTTGPAVPKMRGEKAFPEDMHKLIKYHGSGRDPFMPILADSASPSDIPSAQNLALVGVLVDDVDRIALCEDFRNGNKPYTLREHDRVFKGRVLKIYKDKVVFLLTEYGISRSFTLSIMNNKSITEAGKK